MCDEMSINFCRKTNIEADMKAPAYCSSLAQSALLVAVAAAEDLSWERQALRLQLKKERTPVQEKAPARTNRSTQSSASNFSAVKRGTKSL